MKTIFYTGIQSPETTIPSGWTLHHIPAVTIEFSELAATEFPDWIHEGHYLIFLSRNGVQGFYKFIADYPLQYSDIWCVGAKTADACRSMLSADCHIPNTESALGLIAEFTENTKKPVHLVTAEDPRREFMNWLTDNGWIWHQSVVYKTYSRQDLRWQRLAGNSGDYILFTSPSTVRSFIENQPLILKNIQDMKIIAIGETTGEAIREHLPLIPYIARKPHINEILTEIIHGEFDS